MSRATGVKTRTLHDWHKRGWAKASARAGKRECLRYQRADVERVCHIAALRKLHVGSERAVEMLDAMTDKVNAVFHVEHRPVVTFGRL